MDTSDPIREAFEKCKKYINDSDFESLAESLYSLDNNKDYLNFLNKKLSKKLQETMEASSIKANSLKSIADVEQLEPIYEVNTIVRTCEILPQ
jgi:hypothetical protein